MKQYDVHPDDLAEGVFGSADWTKVYLASEVDAEMERMKAEINLLQTMLEAAALKAGLPAPPPLSCDGPHRY